MYFTGIVIAFGTFIIIGMFHPIIIKLHYYTGTRFWWVLLLCGLMSIIGALFLKNVMGSALLGVFGGSSLWGIGELFTQEKRVQRGWFPRRKSGKKH